MKKIKTRWALFTAVVCFLMIGIGTQAHFRSALFSKSPPSINAITLSFEGVQRDLVPFNITNTSAGECEWNWEIINSETNALVLTSSEKNPTLTLPIGTYDILIRARAKNELVRHFRRAITVLPTVFTEEEADEVIDLSSLTKDQIIKDYRKLSRPGYKILMKGTYNGRIRFLGLHGTKENPVHIINKGQVEINAMSDAAANAILFGNDNQYILFDGKADPNIPYGFKIKGHPKRSGQVFYIAGELNKGFELCGLHVIGQRGKTHGAAAIQVQTTSSPICNADNWNFDYFRSHHNKIEEATCEGYYVGYFTDEVRSNGFSPHRIGQVLIYRDSIINSGWDAIQVGVSDEFEVHDNYVDKASMAGKLNHSSFFSWNSGNKIGWCYRNTFKNSAHAFSIFYGKSGKEAYIYSNLLIEGTFPDSIRTPNFIYAKLDNTHQDIGLYIFNNTIKTSRMAIKVQYNNKDTITNRTMPVVFAGNAIILNQLNKKRYPDIALGNNLKDSLSWTINNQWRMAERAQELQLDKNFYPASASSPVLNSNFDVQKKFTSLKGGFYDHDGYPLRDDEKGYTYGCFSATHLNMDTKRHYGIHKSN